MVGFCHLTDSHHYHHGQKPTMVGICHGGNIPVSRLQSKHFGCLRFAIFCKLKVIVESLEGLWQWQGSRSYHLEISKGGSLGSGLFLTTGCSRFFLEMVQRYDFYLPKSKRGRGGRRQPIWRAASVEEFDSGSLPRLVISSSRRRRLRSESLRRPGWREQAQMKKRWGGDVF